MPGWVKFLPIDKSVLVTLLIELGTTALQFWRKQHAAAGRNGGKGVRLKVMRALQYPGYAACFSMPRQ